MWVFKQNIKIEFVDNKNYEFKWQRIIDKLKKLIKVFKVIKQKMFIKVLKNQNNQHNFIML